MHRAGMGVLQEPSAVRLLLGSEQINRFVNAPVRWVPGRPEVLQSTQHVVVPAGRKRELQPCEVDDGAGALTPEQLPFEKVLLTPAASRDGVRRAAGCALANSPSRTLIVVWKEERTEPSSTSQFHPPSSSCSPSSRATTPIDILIEVGTQRDRHTVDARLDLAARERLAGMLPTAVFSDLRHRPAHLVTMGVDTEVVQKDETVCRGSPGLALGQLAVSGLSPPRGE